MNTRKVINPKWGLPLILALALCLPAGMAAGQPLAAGTTITVNSFGDDITINGNCTLREAVQAANKDIPVDACPAGSGFDKIQLDIGTYHLTLTGAEGKYDDINHIGDLDITNSVEIAGLGPAFTKIEPAGERIFDVLGSSTHAILKGLNLTNARVVDDVRNHPGGCIHNEGILELEGVSINSCSILPYDETILFYGAGIYNEGQLTTHHVAFIDNWIEMDDMGAAALYNAAGATALIEESQFEGNYAYRGTLENHGEMTIRRSQFDRNPLIEGASLRFFGKTLIEDCEFANTEGYDGSLLLAGETIIRNAPFYNNGSYIYNTGTSLLENVSIHNHGILVADGSLTLKNSTIHNTYKETDEIMLVSAFDVIGGVGRIEGSTFTENYNGLHVSGGELTILNSTLSGNNGYGGSLIEVTGGELAIESSTITNNHGDYALHVKSGSATVLNSILNATHWPGEANHTDCKKDSGASLISQGYNIIHIASGCGWVSATGDRLGTTANPLNPRLLALADNGGPTLTHALREGSSALDAGHPSLFPPTDQRGESRPADGDGNGVARADIGAFEAAAPPPKLDEILYLPQLGR